jgi:hypothetical protein
MLFSCVFSVTNARRRKSFQNWTVLKRYSEFGAMDNAVRALFASHAALIGSLPPLPPKVGNKSAHKWQSEDIKRKGEGVYFCMGHDVGLFLLEGEGHSVYLVL